MMHPSVRGIYVNAIGEKAIAYEAARINDLAARQGWRKAIRGWGGPYQRGDDEDMDLSMDCHKAAARAKSNARRRLSRAISNFHLAVKRLT